MITDKNTEKISDIVNKVNELIQKLIKGMENMLPDKITLNDFAHKSSSEIDKVIEQEQQKGNTYITGRFHLLWNNDETFKYSFEMYFKALDNQYLKLNGDSKTIPITYLLEDDINELQTKKDIVYEIEEPNQNQKSSNKTSENVKETQTDTNHGESLTEILKNMK